MGTSVALVIMAVDPFVSPRGAAPPSAATAVPRLHCRAATSHALGPGLHYMAGEVPRIANSKVYLVSLD